MRQKTCNKPDDIQKKIPKGKTARQRVVGGGGEGGVRRMLMKNEPKNVLLLCSYLGLWPLLRPAAQFHVLSVIPHLHQQQEKQCCGSGMFIPDPESEFFPSRIPDPHQTIQVFKNNSKNCFQALEKLFPSFKIMIRAVSSRIRILIFYQSRILDPGVIGFESNITNRLTLHYSWQCCVYGYRSGRLRNF